MHTAMRRRAETKSPLIVTVLHEGWYFKSHRRGIEESIVWLLGEREAAAEPRASITFCVAHGSAYETQWYTELIGRLGNLSANEKLSCGSVWFFLKYSDAIRPLVDKNLPPCGIGVFRDC
jgi:hypothetical protein